MSASGKKAAGTVVKNTSGIKQKFMTLGIRGTTLAPNAVHIEPGLWPGCLAHHDSGARLYEYALKQLETGKLEILSTPTVFLSDADNDLSTAIVLDTSSSPTLAIGVGDVTW